MCVLGSSCYLGQNLRLGHLYPMFKLALPLKSLYDPGCAILGVVLHHHCVLSTNICHTVGGEYPLVDLD